MKSPINGLKSDENILKESHILKSEQSQLDKVIN